jgi:autotransporter-associated beta strand protein
VALRFKSVGACFCIAAGFLLIAFSASAQDATWLNNPGSNDFGVGSNWSTGTVPTGTAFFGPSNTTTLATSGFGQTFGGWTFNAGASGYTVILSPNGVNLITEFVGAGIVVGGGSVSISNPVFFNGMRFSNSSTAGGAQITNSGFVSFVNTSSAASSTITNNLDVTFRNSSSAGNAVIVGVAGSGTFFQDNSTAGNATITNNSAAEIIPLCFCFPTSPGLGFRDNSTAGSSTITTTGLTEFLDRSTGGQARLIASGFGTVRFAATSGPSGDGKVSAGSIEGDGRFVLGSNELTVGGNNLSTLLSGTVAESPNAGGSLVKVGTGTLTLSGINTYTGSTTVNGGALIVDGSTASSSLTIVNAGSALGGSGTVGNTAISGGMLAPGNAVGSSFGPLTVQGNLSFTAASIYMIQVSPANAGRTNVTGAAMFGGATVNVFFVSGSYVAKQYTIVSASGGVSGTFGSLVNTNLPPALGAVLSYDANNAYLNLDLALSQLPGLSGNQRNVANALSGFFNATGGIPMVFAALTPAGLTQAAAEIATGSQQTTFDAMTQFMGVMTDPFIDGRGNNPASTSSAMPFAEEDGANAYASAGRKRSGAERDAYAAVYRKASIRDAYDPRWSGWAAGFGGSQTTDGNAAFGSSNTNSRVFGVAAGADYVFSPRTIAGFALAGGGTNFSVANGGSGRSDLFQAGAFVRHTVGAAYISGALAYGWQDITTDRTVTIAGVDRLRAEFNANAFSGRVEGGYRFATQAIGLTPYAAAQFTTFELPAYAEALVSGADTFALTYGAKSVTASRSELGLRSDKSFAMSDGILTLRGRAAWAHDFNTDRAIAATFQTLPGASFVVNGAAQGHDAALTTASAEMKWLNGFSLAAAFEGEFSDVTRSYAGKGVVRYAW